MSEVEGELRAKAESDGVEFFFAMFVDMHGKPCAKMVPVEALEVLIGGGAGPGVLHARTLAAGSRCAAVRHPRRGPALAVCPAADPEGDAGEGARARLGVQRRLRGGVLPGPARPRWRDRGG